MFEATCSPRDMDTCYCVIVVLTKCTIFSLLLRSCVPFRGAKVCDVVRSAAVVGSDQDVLP